MNFHARVTAKSVDRMCAVMALGLSSYVNSHLVMRPEDLVMWHCCLIHTLPVVSRTTTCSYRTDETIAWTLWSPSHTLTASTLNKH